MQGKVKSILLFVFFFLALQSIKADDLNWWREARLGLFIHWGLYAVPAGSWNGETNHAEWIRTTAEIPIDVYDDFREQFNPVKFNADEWVKMAKNAGMEYIVITTKHHDGFCLFDSEFTEFDIMSTPFKRDIMKELADAAHKEGLKICWYHSIMDWHHPDYLPRRRWEKVTRPENGADYERYVTYMKNQLRELVENYGEIGVLWFDGEWENTWTHERGKDLYNYVKKLQPTIIINNRVDKGRSGMAGLTKDGNYVGDFGTPEQEIPATGLPGVDWETCMTMNNHWGYNKNDDDWKSSKELVQKLVDIASKGGNYLLNVGPTAEGLFPKESVARLKDIGNWMKINSESIYGTSASPFKKLTWGRATQRKIYGGTRLYLHVFNWPKDGILYIPGIVNKATKAYLLSEPNIEIKFTRNDVDLKLHIPKTTSDKMNTVIVLEIDGTPDIVYAPEIKSNQNVFIDTLLIELTSNNYKGKIHYTLDGTEPNSNSAIYNNPFLLKERATIKASIFRDGKRVSPNSEELFERDYEADRNVNGLNYFYYEGEWEKLPEFKSLKSLKSGKIFQIDLDNLKTEDEKYGILFLGNIKISGSKVYTFYLNSNDGSRLYIDDKLVVDNDGTHGELEKEGSIKLVAGNHKFELAYFQAGGKAVLDLTMKKSDGNKTQIPVSMLYPVKKQH